MRVAGDQNGFRTSGTPCIYLTRIRFIYLGFMETSSLKVVRQAEWTREGLEELDKVEKSGASELSRAQPSNQCRSDIFTDIFTIYLPIL